MLGVPEGDYIASAYLSSQTDMLATLEDPIHVGSADVTDLTLTARRATRVFGKYDLRGAKPPAALNTLWVLLDLPPGGRRTMGLIPKADLTFDTLMPAGRYLPSFGAPQGLACTNIMQGGRDVSDAVVVGTEPLELTVVCTDSPNRLTGTTRKDDGAADPDAMIVVFPADRQMWTGANVSPRRFRNTPSQNAGAFNLINLPPGDYFVAAIPIEKSNLWQDAKRLDLIARSATRVSIGATDVRTVDLRTMVMR